MYNIYQIQDDLFKLVSADQPERPFTGTQLEVLTHACHSLDFCTDDLETGFLDMIRTDSNAMHFGFNRGFIFSFKSTQRKVG